MTGPRGEDNNGARHVDAHVHLAGEGALADLAAAGIVAARDAGSKQGGGLLFSQQPKSGVRPVIVSAGRALSRRGGYGAFLGTSLETRQEIAGEIKRLHGEGAGIIKLIASGVVSFEQPGTVTPGGFGAEDIRLIVQEAEKRGLAVMAHANGEAAIITAAEAGVRSIEHGFFMTETALAVLASRRIFWVPTVGALRRAAAQAQVSAAIMASLEEEIRAHQHMIASAFRSGVPLAIGTDCVLPDRRYRGCYEEELALFRGAGIPADAVERMATQGGRELLGLQEMQ